MTEADVSCSFHHGTVLLAFLKEYAVDKLSNILYHSNRSFPSNFTSEFTSNCTSKYDNVFSLHL